MKEQWKPISGYEGYYEISSKGNVRSLDRVCGKTPRGYDRLVKGVVLTPHDNGNGYLMVQLKRDGKRKVQYVHRLVAEAFIPNPDKLPQINHKDFDKSNNDFSNLEWCTIKENITYSAERGRYNKRKRCDSRQKYGLGIRKTKCGFAVTVHHEYLGSFKKLSDAEKVRDEYVRKHNYY